MRLAAQYYRRNPTTYLTDEQWAFEANSVRRLAEDTNLGERLSAFLRSGDHDITTIRRMVSALDIVNDSLSKFQQFLMDYTANRDTTDNTISRTTDEVLELLVFMTVIFPKLHPVVEYYQIAEPPSEMIIIDRRAIREEENTGEPEQDASASDIPPPFPNSSPVTETEASIQADLPPANPTSPAPGASPESPGRRASQDSPDEPEEHQTSEGDPEAHDDSAPDSSVTCVEPRTPSPDPLLSPGPEE